MRGGEFLPERWSEKPELVPNKAAYAPFGTGEILRHEPVHIWTALKVTGHHSCQGRGLATDIMRLVTARIVDKYHIRFAAGENGDNVLGNQRDQFTANSHR